MAERNEFMLNLAGAKEEILFSRAENRILYNYTPPKATVDYQKKFDEAKAPIYVPTKTVVVNQDPPAGQVVPAGTEVKVTLASKGTLPVGSFQVAPEFLSKYGQAEVAVVLKDLEDHGQAVKPILESEKPYETLSQAEKSAVSQYAAGIGLPAGNDTQAKALYEDIQFFHNF